MLEAVWAARPAYSARGFGIRVSKRPMYLRSNSPYSVPPGCFPCLVLNWGFSPSPFQIAAVNAPRSGFVC